MRAYHGVWRHMLLLALVSCGAKAGTLSAHISDQFGKPVADAVLIAVPTQVGASVASAGTVATMDQVGKQFVPFVLVVQAGTLVRFPNQDNIRHHVYSFSPAKHFELPLYSGNTAAPVAFDTPGVVSLGCNIHDWMIGYIYVADSPFFAKTDASGEASIGHLPAGSYIARVWHPSMIAAEADTQRVVSVDAANARATSSWQLELTSPVVQRRAPLPNGRGY